jgi:hypothetical protein
MKHLITLSFLTLAAISSHANATVLLAQCGSGGDVVSIVQSRLSGMAKGDSLVVSGSCAGGSLTISGVDSISIQNLTVQDPIAINVAAATHVSFTGLSVEAAGSTLNVTDHSSVNVSNANLNGWLQIQKNSSAAFSGLVVAGSGAAGGIACLSGSDCQFSITTIIGASSGDPATPSIGLQAASGARLNFASGYITGFDWGVHVWNNATAFFDSGCASTVIDSNKSIGVYVRDGGIAKFSGPDSTCSGGALSISNSATYGLLTEGGGQAFLFNTAISGIGVDPIRVQDGSVVKVRSSQIAAASSTGRSAWVKSQSHLWFNEEQAGPGAGSTLAGPVCVTNSSSVDTDNSSTAVTTTASCTQ